MITSLPVDVIKAVTAIYLLAPQIPMLFMSKECDIDWSERLTLPILGKLFQDALADGEFELSGDRDSDELRLAY